MTSVLIVDDNYEIRLLLRRKIQSLLDASITEAISGQQAIDQIKETSFDLVISDLEMPNGSGLDVYQALTERPNNQSTFIMFTANRLSLHSHWHKQFQVIDKTNLGQLLKAIQILNPDDHSTSHHRNDEPRLATGAPRHSPNLS